MISLDTALAMKNSLKFILINLVCISKLFVDYSYKPLCKEWTSNLFKYIPLINTRIITITCSIIAILEILIL